MADINAAIEDLVAANQILADHGVVDSFGHVSVRHPNDSKRYLLSRARAPQCIVAGDIMEFMLDGTPVDTRGRKPYLERFIHGALYEAQPDIMSVVHSHASAVIPFGVLDEPLRPIMHMCAEIGCTVPVWEPRKQFGDTDMLISNMEQARDLARSIGSGPTVLMRGHGSVAVGRSLREAVYIAVYLQVNASLQMEASRFNKTINFLSPGEIENVVRRHAGGKAAEGYDRAWEGWCRRVGVPFRSATNNAA